MLTGQVSLVFQMSWICVFVSLISGKYWFKNCPLYTEGKERPKTRPGGPNKRQNTPEWYVADFINTGTYTGGL